MNCEWQDIPDTTDARGWRKTVCKRCGHQSAPWPKEHTFNRDCPGTPRAYELNQWVALFTEALRSTRAGAIVAFIRWRAKGSPLDELPTGIPKPGTAPPHAGLTASEVKELFPDEDPTLIGNRIAALTAALGIPTCGGCDKRRQWMNKAHLWLKSKS